jgi:hypothetical protein
VCHPGAAPDAITETEVAQIRGEIVGDLVVPGDVGQVRGHWEITELHPLPRSVGVQRLVGR